MTHSVKPATRLYLLSQLISSIGNHFSLLAIPLVLLRLWPNVAAIPAASLVLYIARVIWPPVAGVVTDRISGVATLGMANVTAMTGMVVAGLLFAANLLNVPILLLVLFTMATSAIFQSVAMPSLNVESVGKKNAGILNAVTLMYSGIGNVIGPVVGGIFIGAFGLMLSLIFDGVTFGAVAASTCGLPKVPPKGTRRRLKTRGMAARVWLLRSQSSRALDARESIAGTLVATVANGAVASSQMYVLYEVLKLTPAELGVFLALTYGMASVTAGRLLAKGVNGGVWGGFSAALAVIVGGVWDQSWPIYGIAMFCANLSITLLSASSTNRRMESVPKSILGRINGLVAWAAGSCASATALLVGGTASQIGIRWGIVVAGIVVMGCWGVGTLVKVRRERRTVVAQA